MLGYSRALSSDTFIRCLAVIAAKRGIPSELFKDVVEQSAFFYGVKPHVYTQICMYLMPTYKTEGMEITTGESCPMHQPLFTISS